jgi:hypothetical protein
MKVEYSLALKEDRTLRIIFYIKWRINDRMKCFIMCATLHIIYGDKVTRRRCAGKAANMQEMGK